MVAPTKDQGIFRDRRAAGERLAEALSFLRGSGETVVLAIPRGGVVVARKIADSIGAPLDIVVTRKIRAPGNPELALGAVTQEGEPVIDPQLQAIVRADDGYLKKEIASEAAEIRDRLKLYRGDKPYPSLRGKTVVVVDDGAATGSTARAAIASVRMKRPAKVILAIPVGSREAVAELSGLADQVVCLSTPETFFAVGQFYLEFEQVDDATVRSILTEGKKGEF